MALGKGLGGGTLHFGLQYVDDIELYKDIPEIKYYLESVNNLTKTQKFDYDTKSTGLWRDIYDFRVTSWYISEFRHFQREMLDILIVLNFANV